jgi:hypothetical protein
MLLDGLGVTDAAGDGFCEGFTLGDDVGVTAPGDS